MKTNFIVRQITEADYSTVYNLTHLYGINHKSMPAEYLQVKELTQRALDGVTGLINL